MRTGLRVLDLSLMASVCVALACVGRSPIPDPGELTRQILAGPEPPGSAWPGADSPDSGRASTEGPGIQSLGTEGLPDPATSGSLDEHTRRAVHSGAVLLFKLRGSAVAAPPEVLTGVFDDSELEARLVERDARILPAFPSASLALPRDTQARALSRWRVLDLPPIPGDDLGPLLAALARSPRIEPGSLTFEDADVARSPEFVGSVRPLLAPSEAWRKRMRPAPRMALSMLEPGFANRVLPDAFRSLRLASAWRRSTGDGIGIAIVDSGLDRNHAALSGRLRAKLGERPGLDADGNGIAGDTYGLSFARLGIQRSGDTTRLVLVEADDWSDWHGVAQVRSSSWGRGTVLAGLAAGSGATGSPLGVAPGAWLLPVDIEENLSSRAGASAHLRELPARNEERRALSPLRSGAWARAVGLVYAVEEGARVATCGWSEIERHPIVREALAYAAARCVVPVCRGRLFQGQPVRMRTLTSNPRNDTTPLPDSRTAERGGALVDLGMTTGAVALILSLRPDLAPEQIVALFGEARARTAPGTALRVDTLLDRAASQPEGRCAARAEQDTEPYWRGRLRTLRR